MSKSSDHLAEFNRNKALGLDPLIMTQMEICNHLRTEFITWNSRLQSINDAQQRKLFQTKLDLISEARIEYCQEKPLIIVDKTPEHILELPLAPWKLSKNAIKMISNIGYKLPYLDTWDLRCYALDEKSRINSRFLGLENTEDRTNVYDALFNSYGQPKTEVDASILIEDGGNLLEMLVPRGEFEGKMQPILRSKQIHDLLL